jgi:hypothetical protein
VDLCESGKKKKKGNKAMNEGQNKKAVSTQKKTG